jgi:DNA-binding CsgD family transcriptional regulator
MARASSNNVISFDEIRAVVHLVTDLHDMPQSSALRRRHMAQQLRELIGADYALSVMFTCTASGKDLLFRDPIQIGGDTASRTLLSTWLRNPAPPDPCTTPLSRLLVRERGLVTRNRASLVSDQPWYASLHVRMFRRAAELDDTIYSVLPLHPPNHFALLLLARRIGNGGPFSAKHRDLVNLLHSEAVWVYREAAGKNRKHAHSLTVRQEQCLQELLSGHGEKEIAARLALSRHTVHVHIKAIYREFGVTSRGELLARFLTRGKS